MEKTHTKIRPIIASHILLPLHSIYINYIPWNLLELVRDFDNAVMWEKKKPSKNQISVITYSYILKPLTFHKMVFLISFASPLEKVDSEFVVNKLQLHKPMSDACHLDWNQISSERVFSSRSEKKKWNFIITVGVDFETPRLSSANKSMQIFPIDKLWAQPSTSSVSANRSNCSFYGGAHLAKEETNR